MATSKNCSGNPHFFSKDAKLSQNDLKDIHEIFKHMVTFTFVQQIAKIHNYNGNAVVNQLVTYSDELSKYGGQINQKKENQFIQKQKNQFGSHKMSFAAQLKEQPIIQFADKKSGNNLRRVKSKSKKELEFERVVALIKSGSKVLILLRGVSGSGKSYLANEIFKKTVGSCPDTCRDYHVYSTDSYFEVRGNFKYDPSLLSKAHEWNKSRFREAIKMGISPVIIDNTNTQKWEMYPYVVEAMQFGYFIETLEPFTPWVHSEYELTRRNVHHVPRRKIRDMLERYESDLTGPRLISIFKLQYPSGLSPPQKRVFPPLSEQNEITKKKRTRTHKRKRHKIKPDEMNGTANSRTLQNSKSSSSSTCSSDSDLEETSDEIVDNIEENSSVNSKFGYLKKIIGGDNNSAWDYIMLYDLENTVNNLQKSYSSNQISSEVLPGMKKSLSENNINYTTSNLYPIKELRKLMDEASICSKKVIYRYSRDELLNILNKEDRIKLEKRFLGESKPQRKKISNRETTSVSVSNLTEIDENSSVNEEHQEELIDWNPVEDVSVKWDDSDDINKETKTELETCMGPLPKRVTKKLSILDEPIVDENIPDDILGHILPTNITSNNKTQETPENNTLSLQDSVANDNDENTTKEKSVTSEITSKIKSFVDLSSLKNFFKLLETNVASETNSTRNDDIIILEEKDILEKIDTVESSTNTSSTDFALLSGRISPTQVDYNVRIIFTNNQDISDNLLPLKENVPPKILKLDKSSMTEGDFQFDESNNEQFLELITIFPSIPKKYLLDVFSHCRGNVNWAVEILLETPNNLVTENTNTEEDVEEKEEETTHRHDIFTEEIKKELVCDLNQEDKVNSLIDIEPSTSAAGNNAKPDKKSQKHLMSESNLEIKKHFEKQFVIADSHYSEHCLKIRRLRHGENDTTKLEQTLSRSGSESSLCSESSESEENLDNEDYFELNLGFDFIERLDSVFEKDKVIYPDGLQSVIQVPKSLAYQLHLLWLESYYQQICAHEERLEQMLKEDEEFAKELQRKENELAKTGEISNVASIQDLINMEIDLEIAKNNCIQESSKDLATKLTLKKLFDMFPSVPQDTISDVYETFNHRYDRTVELLANDLGETNSNNIFDEVNISNQEKQLLEEAKKANLEFSTEEDHPMIVVSNPSTKKVENLDFQEAEKYRKVARQEYKLRNECLEKARVMYNRGLYLVAEYYSELARVHKNKYEKANQYAATFFVSSHTTNRENSTILDLHFLCVTEAIQVLDLFIDNHISKLQDKNKKFVILYVITGRGLRSIDGRARVKPAVLKRLKQRNIRSHFINPGLLKLKLRHYDATTNLLTSAEMPGARCSMINCKNYYDHTKNLGIHYFRFPRNSLVLQEWLDVTGHLNDENFNPKTRYVCSDHFKKEDINEMVTIKGIKYLLNKNAIPISARSKISCTSTATTNIHNLDINEPSVSNNKIVNEIELLRNHIKKLEAENKSLKRQLAKHSQQVKEKTINDEVEKRVNNILSKFLTQNQIDIITEKKKKVVWTSQELTNAFTLRYPGVPGYRYVKEKLKFPLPSLSTLQKWGSRMNLKPGIFNGVLNFMKISRQKLSNKEKLCVLSFDEIKVRQVVEYNQKTDQIVGPHTQMQVSFVRALFSNWKQPVYADFDKKMTKEIINNIISRLYEVGFTVVAIMSDCGSSNMGLWKDLNINMNNVFF